MTTYKKAAAAINGILKGFGEEPIPIPTDGSDAEKMLAFFEMYTEKVIAKNPINKIFEDKREIPDLGVRFLVKIIEEQENKLTASNPKDSELQK